MYVCALSVSVEIALKKNFNLNCLGVFFIRIDEFLGSKTTKVQSIEMDLSRLPSVTFNDVLNDTQFCYHLVYPKFFNLAKKQNRTQPLTSTGTTVKNEKKRRRRGRPRKEETNQRTEEARRIAVENVAADEKSDAKMVPCSRTRSGRVSRPPKHMSKFIETRVSTISDINPIAMDTSEPPLSSNGAEHCTEVAETVKIAPEPKRARKNMDRFTCTTCKKVKHHMNLPFFCAFSVNFASFSPSHRFIWAEKSC